jgi:uncharacterized protein DUF4412
MLGVVAGGRGEREGNRIKETTMKPPIGGILGLVALGMALASSSVEAGFVLTDKDGDRTLVSKGRVKELAGEGPQSVFDLGTARAWMSNPKHKVYWEGTIEELCTTFRETAKSIAKTMEERMEAQLSKLPPDQRAKLEELRKMLAAKRAEEEEKEAPGPGVIKVERTDDTATIAGQPTRRYRVLVDGNLYEEDWLTTDPTFAREFALDKASALMSRVSTCAQSSDPNSRTRGVDEGKIYQKLYPQGWPLKAVSHSGGQARTRTEIETIEKGDIPETEFKPPAGYHKGALSEVMFSGMNGGPDAHGGPNGEE